MPLVLKKSCANCDHFDSYSHYCAFRPAKEQRITQHIDLPARVVCDLHDAKPVEDVDAAPV